MDGNKTNGIFAGSGVASFLQWQPAFLVDRPTGCRIKCGMTGFGDSVVLDCLGCY